MAFVGVEFSEKNTVGLVHSSWFTPLKQEVFWPPYKTSSAFNKALISAEEPDQSTWKISNVKRTFFECDDITKAQKKLKKCEVSSDIQSSELSDLDNIGNKKRKKTNRRRWSSTSSGSEEELSGIRFVNSLKSTKLPRPSGLPQITKPAPLASQPGSSSPLNRSITPATENSQASTSSANINKFTTQAAENSQASNSSANTKLEDIFKEVKKLREELKEVKVILKQSRSLVTASIPSDIPVVLPMNIIEHFQLLEEYLSSKEKLNDLASYLASLGGTGITGLVNRILRTILTNKLATGFNFAGQRSERSSKKAFGTTNLSLTIIRAVQIKSPAATQSDIEHAIKIWLKHAKQRMQKTPVVPVQHDNY